MVRQLFQQLYYITHVENLPSIFNHGILSHRRIVDDRVQFTPIYDASIVSNRGQKTTPDGNTLWDFANLYFQPRNAMLYRVAREKSVGEICILTVRPDIVNQSGVIVSNGNAASHQTEFLVGKTGTKAIPGILRKVNKKWWSDADGSKREMMAECLVPGSVPADSITTVYVGSRDGQKLARHSVPENVTVTLEPDMFFEPTAVIELDPMLHLAEGDLFFSGMQTVTVSVNTVGVMGKGLASTAKDRFPDVYVRYQDACRNKSLRMGKPYIVKRESSFDQDLADQPGSFTNGAQETWFLLFATKSHWRENADFAGIEQGLTWLLKNYKKEGITSVAMPALGCGLGKLTWSDVGPLMCRYLSQMTIPTWIYLPGEKAIKAEEKTREFLLGNAPSSAPVQLSIIA